MGVEERLSRLVELGLRRRGLRGGTLELGDGTEFSRWPRVRAGEAGCGDAEEFVDEVVERERPFIECDIVLLVDGCNGSDSIDSFTSVFCDKYDIAH